MGMRSSNVWEELNSFLGNSVRCWCRETFFRGEGETADCELPQECPCGGRGTAGRSFSKEHDLGISIHCQ